MGPILLAQESYGVMYDAEEHPGCDFQMGRLLTVLLHLVVEHPELRKDSTGTTRHIVVFDTALLENIDAGTESIGAPLNINKVLIRRMDDF